VLDNVEGGVKDDIIKLLITHKNIELKVRVDTLVTETLEFGIFVEGHGTHMKT